MTPKTENNMSQHSAPSGHISPARFALIHSLVAIAAVFAIVVLNVFDLPYHYDSASGSWYYDKIAVALIILLSVSVAFFVRQRIALKSEIAWNHRLHNDLILEHKRLEQVVADRTKELSAANAELAIKVVEGEQRESDLIATQSRLHNLITRSPIIMYTSKASGDFGATFISETIFDLLGYEPNEFLSDSTFWVDHIHPEDRPRILAGLSNLFENGWHSHEYRFLNKAGEYRWMYDELRLELDDDGQPKEIVGYWIDITKLKATQSELLASRQRYEELFGSVMEGVAIVDPDENVVLCNPAFASIFGLETAAEMGGRNLFEFIPKDKRGQLQVESDRRIQGERSAYELDIVAADGKEKTILASIAPRFEDGIYRGTIGAILDISDRKKAEMELEKINKELEIRVNHRTEALTRTNQSLEREMAERARIGASLRASEQRFREMAELLPDGIFEANDSLAILYANKTLMQYFGCESDHLSNGWSLTGMAAEKDILRFRQYFTRISQGSRQQLLEFTAQRQDGSTFEASIKASMTSDGGQKRIRGIVSDLTVSKKQEAELQKSEKLESVGLLAGGLAHDFNNLLTGVLGNLSLALLDLTDGNESTTRIRDAEKAALRAQDLTRQLLTLSKGGDPIRKSASIGDILHDVVTFVLSGSPVNSDFAIDSQIDQALVDAGQISQVIHNLAINAVQAMPNGGKLTVCASNMDYCNDGTLPLDQSKYIKITVRDTGTGIPPEHLTKIFDPYFTTKSTGSGLGLATSYSIIRKHSGHMEVESTVGVGTEFRIYLPSAGQTPIALEIPKASSHRGAGRILIMDDELFVRDLTCSMLERMGYEIESAKDGNEALKLYKQALDSGTRFDAVILDLTIPGGLGGKETMDRLRELDADVKAIVCSGYSNDQIMARYQEYGFKGLVEKPYRIEDLSRTLTQVLSKDHSLSHLTV